MAIFEEFEKKLQANPKSIVFTEGTDARILSAASKLLAAKTLKVILLGEVEAVKKAAADGGFDITGAELLDPKAYDGMDEMAAKMVELRKGKMTDEQCREALSKGNYFDYHNKYAPDGAQEPLYEHLLWCHGIFELPVRLHRWTLTWSDLCIPGYLLQ